MLKKLFAGKAATELGTAPSGAAPTLDQTTPNLATQQQLHQLNLDFLRLLQAVQPHAHEHWAKHLRLGDALSSLLQAATETQLQRMAQCDFALFTAAFAQPECWQTLQQRCRKISDAERYADMQPGHTAVQQHSADVCQAVLFFSWHLSQQSPRSARLLLGMSDATLCIISTMSIWECQFIARHYCEVLQPRWQIAPSFWHDLLHFGLTGHAEHERMLRSLSRHLTARELEPSAIMRLSKEEA